MNILSIGSKITLRKISEEIVDKVESINFLDTTTNNFLNWGLSKTKKINYYSSGSNAYGQRGIDIAPGGGNTYDEVYDVPSENYAGADRWARMRSVLFPV